MKDSPLKTWLLLQPKEFVDDVSKNEMLGDGYFALDNLIELDCQFNPEDENSD